MTTLRQLIQTSPARVNELFAKLVDTSETAVKTREKIFTELRGELELLADLEEQHLFPVLRKHKELKDLVREALNDNKATRKLLTELDHTPKDNEEFASRVAELRRVFQQHVRDEKKEFLPAVLKALSDEEAEAVVDRIEAGKAEIEEAKRAEAEERRAEAKREREQAEAEQARIEAAERAEAQERRAAARQEREEAERVQQAAEAVVDVAWTAPRTAERAARSVQEVAERSLTQAREALENFWRASRQSAEAVEKTGDRVQAETRDMARRAFSSAEQNIRTTLDYAERLVRARDLQEAARIQAEFVRSQAEAMQTQMREFGSAVQSGISRAAPQTVSEADQAASPKTTRGRREEA